MDYYQGVVVEYLRADRAVFVNTECLIQLDEGPSPDKTRHWFCDALAVDFKTRTVWLCEISYSKTAAALLKRLAQWNAHWPAVKAALVRDCQVPADFAVRPWLFIPGESVPGVVAKLSSLGPTNGDSRLLPDPRITTLEAVTPWTHCTWNRTCEAKKPESIPSSMRE